MRNQVPKRLDEPGQLHEFDGGFEHMLKDTVRQDDGVLRITAKLFLTYTGNGSINNVTVTLKLPTSVMTKTTTIHIPTLRGSSATPMILDITFYANCMVLPTDPVVGVTAMFFSNNGEPRTAQTDIVLPMFFFCR